MHIGRAKHSQQAQGSSSEQLWTWVLIDLMASGSIVQSTCGTEGTARDQAHLDVSHMLSNGLGPNHEAAVVWRAGVENDRLDLSDGVIAIFPFEGDLKAAEAEWRRRFIEDMNAAGHDLVDLNALKLKMATLKAGEEAAQNEANKLQTAQWALVSEILDKGVTAEWVVETFGVSEQFVRMLDYKISDEMRLILGDDYKPRPRFF